MKTITKQFQLLLFFLITAAAAWFDQFTKKWALANLGDHKPVPLIDGILEFLRIENHGAAFGILQGQMSFFYVISAVVGVVILYVLLRMPCEAKYFPLLVTISFIAAGAVGNLIDRVFLGYVRDMIELLFIRFYIFNFADICVTLGAACCAVMLLLPGRKETP